MKLPRSVVGSVVCSVALTAVVVMMSGRRPAVEVPDVRPEVIRTHLRFLADDAQEGRMTGTPGFDRAARYVTTQFERLGLEPAFGGRFEQPMSLLHAQAVGGDSSITLRRGDQEEQLAFAADFVTSGDLHRESTSVSAPIVFVGDGISAPDLGYDDYEDVDVTGKVVAVVLRGIPVLQPAEAAYFGNLYVRIEQALQHGAVGLLILGADDSFPWKANQQLALQGLTSVVGPSGQPLEPSQPIAVGVLRYAASQRLMNLASVDFAETIATHQEEQLPAMELPVTGTIRINATHSTRESANIGAVLPGSDPDLKDEYVVFAAHLDHVGRGRPVNGDDIYSGAVDNASGVAEMLAMAQAMKRIRKRPRRSVLFLATAGEEIGNLGAKYFVAQPPMPLDDIAALVNVDGPTLMMSPVTGVNAVGGSHSTLGRVAAAAAIQLGLRIQQSTAPTRGDQGPFLMRGVPLLWPLALPGPNRTGADEAAREREFNARNYHQPTDDLNRAFDYDAAATMATFDLLVGLQVAQEDARPQWNRGDFYGDRFARTARP